MHAPPRPRITSPLPSSRACDQDAIACADQAVEAAPEHARAYVDRAFACLKSGLSEAAVQDFEAALAHGDDAPETLRLYSLALAVEGDKHLSSGQDAAALECYEKALDITPADVDPNPNILFNFALAKVQVHHCFTTQGTVPRCVWQCP